MDLDLQQVRAFVAAAHHEHFGRAATSLFLTQQALSKRIARLEDTVGVLFERGSTGVTLTERGLRFLPAAYQLLETADHALAVARGQPPTPLRVDLWGPFEALENLVRRFTVEHPDVEVEVGMRRNLRDSVAALRRQELDVAFGNTANLKTPLPEELSSAIAILSPSAGLVDAHNPLADADIIGPDELRRHGLALPTQESRQEFANFVSEYATTMGVPLSTDNRNTALPGVVDRVGSEPDSITLVPADWTVPEGAGLRLVPLRPIPVFPWYVLWRTTSPHPHVATFVRTVRRTNNIGDLKRDLHWLPAAAQHLLTDRAR